MRSEFTIRLPTVAWNLDNVGHQRTQSNKNNCNVWAITGTLRYTCPFIVTNNDTVNQAHQEDNLIQHSAGYNHGLHPLRGLEGLICHGLPTLS